MITGCAGYRTTAFKHASLKIDAKKNYDLQKHGYSFKSDVSEEDGEIKEILRYKEAVDIGSHTYILTPDLYSTNGELIKIEQKESDLPSSTKIQVEKSSL